MSVPYVPEYVRFVDCGSVHKFMITNSEPKTEMPFSRIPGVSDFYIDKHGYPMPFKHSEVKGDNIDSVKRTFARVADLINCNFESPEQTLFVTLTYANQPTLDKLSKDIRTFFADFRSDICPCEYLYVIEQQARGVWHVHALVFAPFPVPFIPSPWLDAHWKFKARGGALRGLWNVERLDVEGVHNVGVYICAHFTDGQTEHKQVKNARLENYPSRVHLYRCSRGIKRPIVVKGLELSDYLEYSDANVDRLIYDKHIVNTRTVLDSFYHYEHYQADSGLGECSSPLP